MFALKKGLWNCLKRGFNFGRAQKKGHSHWDNTKHEKARLASIKSKEFSDFSRQIVRAVRGKSRRVERGAQIQTRTHN